MKREPLRAPPPFVGDLSTQDAAVLATLAHGAKVLEHGAGGSTQIFARVGASVVCVENDPVWVERTAHILDLLDLGGVEFRRWSDGIGPGPYDIAFVDGEDELRLEFAIAAMDVLVDGGLLVFHDCRRIEDKTNVIRLARACLWRVGEIEFDVAGSNLAVVRKCPVLKYEDWNVAEEREPWEHGASPDLPEGFVDRVAHRTSRCLDLAHDVPYLPRRR